MASCKDCIHKEACNHWLKKENCFLEEADGFICKHFKDRSKLISIGINKSEGECINFEKLICPYCYKEIEWDTFYSEVDKYDILSTDAAVSNDYCCPHCKKAMRVCLDVLILSEQKESELKCQKE